MRIGVGQGKRVATKRVMRRRRIYERGTKKKQGTDNKRLKEKPGLSGRAHPLMSTGRMSCWTRVLFFRPATASDSGITACNTEEEDDCSIVLKKKMVIAVLKVLPHSFLVIATEECAYKQH